ncbi:hypothetical protein J2S13_003089 [Oikeobacillus pervagus]|uniref:Uncharacterized protein n=1 Tax=Oikeobacillus pervagus TaxID=1325931 RepID=A0AAJ1WKC9_9BACI|nr:hypothetical protein [Oikeobacillus pervagus]MDQ0216615.1 hypothetical protein [Oikeobacillus pervagus]
MAELQTKLMQRKIVMITVLFILLVIIIFLIFSPFSVERKEERYVRKMNHIYLLMARNKKLANDLIQHYEKNIGNPPENPLFYQESNSWDQLKTNYSEQIQELQKGYETSSQLLQDLPEPPEPYITCYSLLLDAHILYRQYINLALHPTGTIDAYRKKQLALYEEMNEKFLELEKHLKLQKHIKVRFTN